MRVEPLVANNAITMQMLCTCSALAVTTQVDKAFVLSAGGIMVAVLASLSISLIRERTPALIRIIVQLAIIASLVIVFDQVLKATLYEIWLELSVFVGLIITNCIMLGCAEGFAMANPPRAAAIDAFGNALGYALILVVVAFVHELLGAGTVRGFTILPLTKDGGWYPANGLMLLAPSALFIIGLMIWAMRSWMPALQDKD